ncbi:sulfotransferase 1B1-like [Mya arenaria]|uniref:sulfotransferase 1B1-like n=1 Tax=Mya arenaria TaxID=6604 RepID=UPI0022E35629|nr:sulfotransferase 1B1-like [Mya arenaria]
MEWVRGAVRNEAGRGFDTLTSGELVLPAKFDLGELNSQLEAVRELPYQQGDILICNYGKTGTYMIIFINGLAKLRRLSDFLSVHNTDERLRQILDRCSFDRLKKDTESGKVVTKLVDKEGRPFLYRKGIVGDWKNYFTVAQSERFDTLEETYKEDIF